MDLRGRNGGLAALIVLAIAAALLVAYGLGLFGSSGSSGAGSPGPSTQPGSNSTTPVLTQPGAVVTTPGQSGGQGSGSSSGTFSVTVPAGASGAQRTTAGNLDQLTFAVGAVQVAVAAQPQRAGETLDQVASIYGRLTGRKITSVAGQPAYLFPTVSGGRFSIVVIGRSGGHDYSLQLVGPSADYDQALALAKRLGPTVKNG